LVAFLYTNDEQTEKEIRDTIPFTIAPPEIKYFRINLMEETEEIFNEIYKPLREKLKKTSEDGKNSHVYGLVESTL
jgi:hypothetical protein